MPYWLESDTFADDPVWEVLAEGNLDRLDALQAAYARLMAKASHLLSDGYLTASTALRYARGRRALLDRLCTPVLDRPAMVHRRGEECDCLGDKWIEGYDFRIHNFLKKNPSKREYMRNKEQRRDREDARLKAMVWARDGGCCRYCNTGPLSPKAGRSRDRRKILQFDHVDPDAAAGPEGEGYVTACAVCNEYKGHRTPDEADMVLLPVPTSEQAAEWRTRPQQLHDRPPLTQLTASAGSPADQPQISAEPAAEQQPEQKPDQNQTTDPNTDSTSDENTDHTPQVGPDPTGTAITAGPDQRPQGSGSGRVGEAALISKPAPPPLPPRTGLDPDIYTRRSRAAPAPPPPEYIWPPGSVPVTAPDDPPAQEDPR